MANPLGHRYAFISLWLRIKHLHRDGCSTRPGSSSHSALTAKGKGGGGIRKRTPTPKQQTFAKRGWFWSQEHQFLGRINDVTVHSWRKDDDSCIYLFVFCLLWWSSVPPLILVRFHLRLRRGSKCSRPTWMSPPSGIHPRCTRTDTSLCKKTKTKTNPPWLPMVHRTWCHEGGQPFIQKHKRCAFSAERRDSWSGLLPIFFNQPQTPTRSKCQLPCDVTISQCVATLMQTHRASVDEVTHFISRALKCFLFASMNATTHPKCLVLSPPSV